jgi:hypothetical protein
MIADRALQAPADRRRRCKQHELCHLLQIARLPAIAVPQPKFNGDPLLKREQLFDN